MKLQWIPEAPKYPGVYASEPTPTKNCTTNVDEALKFDRCEDCLRWCRAHPVPEFLPVEHGFGL